MAEEDPIRRLSASISKSHDKMDRILNEVGDLKVITAITKTKVDKMEPIVDELKLSRAKALGYLGGLTIAGGTIGALIKELFTGKH